MRPFPQLLVLLAGALLAAPDRARGDEPSDTGTEGCGDDCPGTGVNVLAQERPIHLSGRTLDEVVRSYRSQTERHGHVVPDHPRITFCMRCGSVDHAQGLTLNYILDVATPIWDPPDNLADEDKAAIARFVAAVEGHNNRHVANHRDRLAAVAWEQLPLPEIEGAFRSACEAAIAADNALDTKEGCWVVTTSLAFEARPRSACEPNWKGQNAKVCWLR